MSYARWSEGDVYVFHHVDAYLICMCCTLTPLSEYETLWGAEDEPERVMLHDDYKTQRRSEMIAHLAEHQAAGHGVPSRAARMLAQEIGEEGDEIVRVFGER